MKKEMMILALSVLAALCVALVMQVEALGPCPIALDFEASPPGSEIGLNAEISYLDKIVWKGMVNEYSEIVADLGGLDIPNCNFQSFKLVILECKDDPICTKTVAFNPDGYTLIDLKAVDFFGRVCPSCPAILEDTTPYEKCDTCCPTPETCPICPVCDTCPEEKICPGFDINILSGVAIFAILSALALAYSSYRGYFQFQIREKYVNSSGNTAYKWKTIFKFSSNTSSGKVVSER